MCKTNQDTEPSPVLSYDPNTGRFINADDTDYLDATGTVLGCNLFAYCENDPVNYVDMNGTLSINLSNVHRKYTSNKSNFNGTFSFSITLKQIRTALRCISYTGLALALLCFFVPEAVSKAVGITSGIIALFSAVFGDIVSDLIDQYGANYKITIKFVMSGTFFYSRYKYNALQVNNSVFRNYTYSKKTLYINQMRCYIYV